MQHGGGVGRKRPCHGEPVPIDLRFQLHQATLLEADHLGLLVAYDQQRGKPAEERHVADERKRLVLGPCSKPQCDRYHRVIRRKTRSSLNPRLHTDLPHKQLRSLRCAQLSAVQAAADPHVSSPGSLSDTLHRRSTGIREGSLGILCFGRRLTVLHQVQVHVGYLRWFHHHPADARSRAVLSIGGRCARSPWSATPATSACETRPTVPSARSGSSCGGAEQTGAAEPLSNFGADGVAEAPAPTTP